MKPIKLTSGTTIPPVGFGLWLNKNREICISSVQAALAAGYRHFDTAQVYSNEIFIGWALANSGIPRSDLFITTKIWNDNQWWDDLIPSFDESLQRLETDYVDLLLLHFPVTETRRPAWRLMEKLYNDGRAKAIGVSNYTVAHLEELLKESSIKPAINQVELHVFLQQPQLVKYCQDHDIVVQAYSPLAHGEGLANPILVEIAKKHSKTVPQVMIRWCLQIGTVPLPKSVTPERIVENIDVFDFELDTDDMRKFQSLESNLRTAWDPTHTP
jgi:diketogulonate reductase-like aldo/keto reductase